MDDRIEHLKESVTARYERLEESNKLGPLVATGKRFFLIEGLDLAGLLALELFTTIIPLVLLGYSFASDFNENLSFADFMIKWMDLRGDSADAVQGLFGDAGDLRSTWTFLGIAGFLFWGIPMSAQVAKTFARAFQRERWSFWTEVWRGGAWFAVLLASQILTVLVTRGIGWTGPLNVLAWIPSFILWSVSPLILVRNGTAGWKHMAWCGLAGLVLDLFGVRITLRWVFPKLLAGWTSFGPIGVAMAMMTTCTVIAVLWVVTACLGAVLWERRASPETVVESQMTQPAAA
jgi:hypothetical protein